MDNDNKPVHKSGLGEDLVGRIKFLEQAKTEPELTKADIEALERVIVKLKERLAEKESYRGKENKEKEDN